MNNKPCTSCPYRKDVPSGIWHEGEYDKILPYDRDTSLQPPTMFGCHQADGSVCRGWLHCHGTELLAVRLRWDESIAKMLEAGPGMELFGSAKEASEHGRRDLAKPKAKAKAMMKRLKR